MAHNCNVTVTKDKFLIIKVDLTEDFGPTGATPEKQAESLNISVASCGRTMLLDPETGARMSFSVWRPKNPLAVTGERVSKLSTKRKLPTV